MKFQYPSGSRALDGFVIKRGIGRGGFGEVYFATSDAGKELALKHIERNLEVELRGVSQCLNLKHPNLIDLYDIKYDDLGDAWVVMEKAPTQKESLVLPERWSVERQIMARDAMKVAEFDLAYRFASTPELDSSAGAPFHSHRRERMETVPPGGVSGIALLTRL